MTETTALNIEVRIREITAPIKRKVILPFIMFCRSIVECQINISTEFTSGCISKANAQPEKYGTSVPALL